METSPTASVAPLDPVPHGSVVVGVDGSHHSDRAVGWAAAQADAENRPLLLVTGIGILGSTGTVWLTSTGADYSPTLAAMRDEAARLLETTAAEVRARYPFLRVHQRVEDLDGSGAVLRHATTAALVVVGSRGRGPLRSRLLGSVSLAVAGRSPVPVVVVRPFTQGMVRRGVLVGVDGTPGAAPVLEEAFRQAALHQLPLTAVSALWGPVSPGDEQEASLRLSESLAGFREKFPDVHVESSVVHGHPIESLVEASARMNLVVVGHRDLHGLRRLVEGSISAGVLERADTPVLVVPWRVAD